ncbi:MAG: DegV family protein [Caldilineales bacterium]|nr:DegV family protein [Caldilineales bacterium]
MAVRVICDSSCNIPESYQQSLNIIQVPAWINFADGTSLRNGVDISDAEFYDRLIHEKTLPTTSQPTPQDFADAIAGVPAEDDIVLGAVSSKLSGTHNSCVQACMLIPNRNIQVFDTLSASLGAGWQIIAGAEAAQAGADVDGVLKAMGDAQASIYTVVTIDTLKYLAASGRAPALQAMLGGLLNIKPLLHFSDGTLDVIDRVRGRKKSKRAVIDRIESVVHDAPLRIAVANANIPDEAAEYGEEIRSRLNVQELITIEIGPVLGALAGPGTLAVGAWKQTASA